MTVAPATRQPRSAGVVGRRRRWTTLTYLHWQVPLTQVAERLPAGLAVDTHEGRAWIGLVPFETTGFLGSFPETTVRTYVVGPDGPGLWFDSFDIGRLAPVAVARSTYGLPYNWARMNVTRRGDIVRYEAARRWPERNASSCVAVATGRVISQPDTFELFVSARRRLYATIGRRLVATAISHDPWPLRAARLTDLDDTLITAAGYTPLDDEPHVMFSPGVSVTIGRPRRL